MSFFFSLENSVYANLKLLRMLSRYEPNNFHSKRGKISIAKKFEHEIDFPRNENEILIFFFLLLKKHFPGLNKRVSLQHCEGVILSTGITEWSCSKHLTQLFNFIWNVIKICKYDLICLSLPRLLHNSRYVWFLSLNPNERINYGKHVRVCLWLTNLHLIGSTEIFLYMRSSTGKRW